MSDFIRYYDDVLTKEQCKSFIDTTKELMNKSSDGIKHTVGGRDYHRLVSGLYTEQQNKLVRDILKDSYARYKEEFALLEDYSKITNNWKIHYNKVGGYVDWHNDLGGNSEMTWRRIIVFIIYLNDLDEGELQFKYFPDVSVMPKAGRLLMMPTAWPWIHKADKLFQEKYILTGFYYHEFY